MRGRTGSYDSAVPRGRTRTRSAVATRTVITAAVFALVFLLCFLYLWQGTTILFLTAQQQSARATLDSITEVNRELQFRVDQAFSLDRIEQIARNQLHMTDPKVVRYITITNGS